MRNVRKNQALGRRRRNKSERVKRIMYVEVSIIKEQVVVNMLEGNGREEVDWSKGLIDFRRL